MMLPAVYQVPPYVRVDAVQLPFRVFEKTKTRPDCTHMPPLNVPCPREKGILSKRWCLDVSALAHSHDLQTSPDRVFSVLKNVRGVNKIKVLVGEGQVMNVGHDERLIVRDEGFVSEFRLQEALGKNGCVWKRLSAAANVEDTHSWLDLEVDITCLVVDALVYAWVH